MLVFPRGGSFNESVTFKTSYGTDYSNCNFYFDHINKNGPLNAYGIATDTASADLSHSDLLARYKLYAWNKKKKKKKKKKKLRAVKTLLSVDQTDFLSTVLE